MSQKPEVPLGRGQHAYHDETQASLATRTVTVASLPGCAGPRPGPGRAAAWQDTMKASKGSIFLHMLPEECICAVVVRLPLNSVGLAAVAHRSIYAACKLESTMKELWYVQISPQF